MAQSFPGIDANYGQVLDQFARLLDSEDQQGIESFLQQESADSPHLQAELVRMEIRWRLHNNQHIDWHSYLERFPDQQQVIAKLRHESNETASHSDSSKDPDATSINSGMHSSDFEWETLGEYELISQIGRGGMGVVYKARHLEKDELVAVKILPLGSSSSKSARTRFQIEAKAAAQLDFPHIVPVYDFGFKAGIHYYAMQYIEGGNLAAVIDGIRDLTSREFERGSTAPPIVGDESHVSTVLDRQTYLSTLEASGSFDLVNAVATKTTTSTQDYWRAFARIGVQVASALHYAHSMGIVHRDIKPSNLLVDHEGNVFVSDFGLARVQGETELTAPGSILGTLRYMSPEQAYAQRIVVDHRTDLFSLGATLYELLLLQHAFDGQSKPEILKQIAFQEPIAPRKLDPRLPEDLETIVLKCLAKNPDERYQSGEAVAKDLQSWLDNRPISARPPSPIQKAVKWARNHKVVVQSGVLVLVILIMSIFSALAFAVQTERAARKVTEEKNSQLAAALNKSESGRLSANAFLELIRNPGLAAALSKEASLRHENAETRTAVHAAVSQNRERLVIHRQSEVSTVDFDPDGKRFLIAHQALPDRAAPSVAARICSSDTGNVIYELQDQKTITSAVFDPTGQFALTCSSRSQSVVTAIREAAEFPVSIWDADRGLKLGELKDSLLLETHANAFYQQGDELFVVSPATENRVCLYNTTGQIHQTLQGHTDHVSFAAFSRSGNRIVSISNDQTVRVWDARTGDEIAKLSDWDARLPVRQVSPVQYAVFSPDETQLLTVSRVLGVQLWDIDSQTARPCGRGQQATFSPDGEQIAIVTDKTVRLLDAITLTEIHNFADHDNTVTSAKFSSTGHSLAVTTYGNHVFLWDCQTGLGSGQLNGHLGTVNSICFHPTEDVIATASNDATARLWNLTPGVSLAKIDQVVEKSPAKATFSHNGQFVALAAKRRQRCSLVSEDLRTTHFSVMGLAAGNALNGNQFVSYTDHHVTVWNWKNKETKAEFHRRSERIAAVSVHPNGKDVLIATQEGSLWHWHWPSDMIASLLDRSSNIYAVTYHPESQAPITGGSDGVIRQWDLETNSAEKQYETQGIVRSLDFAPSGDHLLVVSGANRAVVIDSALENSIMDLQDPAARFLFADYSPTGKYILTHGLMGADHHCWDATTGAITSTVKVPGRRVMMHSHKTLDRVLLVAVDREIQEWDLESGSIVRTIPGRYETVSYIGESTQLYASTAMPLSGFSASVKGYQPPALVKFPADSTKASTEIPVKDSSVIGIAEHSDQGMYLLANRVFPVEVYDRHSGEKLNHAAAHGAFITFAEFAPDHSVLVTCSLDSRATVWDAKKLVPIHQLDDASAPILTAAIDHNSQYLVAGCMDGTLVAWDLKTGKLHQTFDGLEKQVQGISFAANASRIAAFTRDTGCVWDFDSGKKIEIPELNRPTRTLLYQPNGNTLVSYPLPARSLKPELVERLNLQKELDVQEYVVNIHHRNGRVIPLRHKTQPKKVYFSATGNEVITVHGESVKSGDVASFWDADTGELKMTATNPGSQIFAVTTDTQNHWIIARHLNSLSVWKSNGTEHFAINEPIILPGNSSINTISPDAEHLMGITKSQTIKMIPLNPLGNDDAIRSLTPQERKKFAANELRP